MKVRLTCFYIFLCLGFRTYSQTQMASLSLRNKPDDFVYKVSGGDRPLKFLFQNESEYELTCLDSIFKTTFTYICSPIDKQDRFTTSFETDSALSLYMVNIKTGEYSVLTTFPDSTIRKKKLFKERDKEHFLKSVTLKDRVCALSVDQVTNRLYVRSYWHGTILSLDTFNVEYPNFFTALQSEVNSMNQEPFSDIGITFINEELEQDLSSLYTDRKLYVRDDKLIFTFDESNTSHLIFIDLTKKKSYYKKFNFKLDLETSPLGHKGNSYLFKDYFFRITCDGHQLNLAIVDFRNFKLVRNHNVYDSKPIEIRNGPILNEESTNGSVPTVEIIKTTDKYFKKMRGSDLGVTARELPDGNYELMLGSHHTEVRSSPVMGPSVGMGMGMGMGIGMSMGGFGMGGYGMGMDPFYYPYGMGSRNYSVTIEKTYFHSLLTSKEFTHISQPLENGFHDKKKLFWDKNFRSGRVPEIGTDFRWKGKLYYGYWDKKLSKFAIVQF